MGKQPGLLVCSVACLVWHFNLFVHYNVTVDKCLLFISKTLDCIQDNLFGEPRFFSEQSHKRQNIKVQIWFNQSDDVAAVWGRSWRLWFLIMYEQHIEERQAACTKLKNLNPLVKFYWWLKTNSGCRSMHRMPISLLLCGSQSVLRVLIIRQCNADALKVFNYLWNILKYKSTRCRVFLIVHLVGWLCLWCSEIL